LRAWAWQAGHTCVPFSRKFVKTLRNLWHEILNYLEGRVTNGFVEGINGSIRTIINRTYGYRNFENFQLQILIQYGPPVPLPH